MLLLMCLPQRANRKGISMTDTFNSFNQSLNSPPLKLDRDVDTLSGTFSEVTAQGLGSDRDLMVTVRPGTVSFGITTGGTGKITQRAT
jgi:hypothetical protein